eukprot:CAMPEP_0185293168 /NCGR_PEP_ID=MMETSP1363-20130426/6638_1 /TAXON_ID=38817 /ORGANISM="Gephyrocapsa oceanica, Strain RCC1303" /LENGTH=30 /DNA_ID= /DNA_START= /DNA_END= /DNA_ORIENTATION=
MQHGTAGGQGAALDAHISATSRRHLGDISA